MIVRWADLSWQWHFVTYLRLPVLEVWEVPNDYHIEWHANLAVLPLAVPSALSFFLRRGRRFSDVSVTLSANNGLCSEFWTQVLHSILKVCQFSALKAFPVSIITASGQQQQKITSLKNQMRDWPCTVPQCPFLSRYQSSTCGSSSFDSAFAHETFQNTAECHCELDGDPFLQDCIAVSGATLDSEGYLGKKSQVWQEVNQSHWLWKFACQEQEVLQNLVNMVTELPFLRFWPKLLVAIFGGLGPSHSIRSCGEVHISFENRGISGDFQFGWFSAFWWDFSKKFLLAWKFQKWADIQSSVGLTSTWSLVEAWRRTRSSTQVRGLLNWSNSGFFHIFGKADSQTKQNPSLESMYCAENFLHIQVATEPPYKSELKWTLNNMKILES